VKCQSNLEIAGHLRNLCLLGINANWIVVLVVRTAPNQNHDRSYFHGMPVDSAGFH